MFLLQIQIIVGTYDSFYIGLTALSKTIYHTETRVIFLK